MINTRRELQYSHIPRLIILFLLPADVGAIVGAIVGAVVGAVVGVLFILFISGVGIYFCKPNRKGEIYLLLRINFFDHV